MVHYFLVDLKVDFLHLMIQLNFLVELSFFFFFCENLVDFNEARLHEATLNLHTHA